MGLNTGRPRSARKPRAKGEKGIKYIFPDQLPARSSLHLPARSALARSPRGKGVPCIPRAPPPSCLLSHSPRPGRRVEATTLGTFQAIAGLNSAYTPLSYTVVSPKVRGRDEGPEFGSRFWGKLE